MSASQNLSFFNCELRIIRAKNTEFLPVGNLFVRYYLRAGDNRRIRLTSREIPSTCDPCWNDIIKLECLGSSIDRLKTHSVILELRLRKTSSMLGKIGRSKLLFRAETGWKDVLNSTELSLLKWVTSPRTCKFVPEGFKSPALEICMKIQDSRVLKLPKRNHMTSTECGCGHGGCNGRDEDIFALAASLKVF